MMTELQEKETDYEHQRHERPERQRAIGGGAKFDLPLVIRVMMLLTYLRLAIPQAVVALLFGATQSDLSRDLRRLLPLIKQVLPCPEIWKVIEMGEPSPLSDAEKIALADLDGAQVLIDATEQPVNRPKDEVAQKAHYSGKQKAHTLKTQVTVTDEHIIKAISEVVPGSKHDKKLADQTQTVERLPDGCEANLDKGYQGVANQVELVKVINLETGQEEEQPRLQINIPFKKPKGGELTSEQKDFNRELSSIRIRVEHCIGWVKNWAILSIRYRCAHEIYTSIMQVVCGLVNAQTKRWQTAKHTAAVA